MYLVTFRKCAICKKHAGVAVFNEGSVVLFCLSCSKMFEIYPRYVLYVCSIEGCSATPEFITLLGDGDISMTFLCPEHFRWCREELSTVLVISKRMDLEEWRSTENVIWRITAA